MNVEVQRTRPVVEQPVDEVREAVEGKDDGLAAGEERIEALLVQAVRMIVGILQCHQIDDVDEAHAHLGHPVAQEVRRGQRLHGRHVAGAGEDHIGLHAVAVIAGPVPDAEPRGAMHVRLLRRQPLRGGLLADDHRVDSIIGRQAVIHDPQQAIGIGRQIDARDIRLLAGEVIDEARILVAETVVILSPDVAREEIVERRDRLAPFQLARQLQPLGMLVDHRIDDRRERLVATEQAVPPGQQISLQPALAAMFRQNLHHSPVPGKVIVIRLDPLGPHSVGGGEYVAQPVRRRLVRPDQAEGAGTVAPDDLGEVAAERAG